MCKTWIIFTRLVALSRNNRKIKEETNAHTIHKLISFYVFPFFLAYNTYKCLVSIRCCVVALKWKIKKENEHKEYKNHKSSLDKIFPFLFFMFTFLCIAAWHDFKCTLLFGITTRIQWRKNVLFIISSKEDKELPSAAYIFLRYCAASGRHHCRCCWYLYCL